MARQWRIFLVAALILSIGLLHYSCQLYLLNHAQLHNVFYKLLYVPILLSAYWWGLRGGGLVALLCGVVYGFDVVRWWNPSHPFHYNRISEPVLFLVIGVLLGALVDSDRRAKQGKRFAEQTARSEHQKAITDPLTHAYNRRHMEKTLQEFWEMAHKGGAGFSLLMIDLNHFKDINDRYGHPVGDRVLRSTVQTIFNNSRKTDLVFRYGGDEFLVLLPMTAGAYALNLANRLREEIAKLTFKGQKRENFKADFSIGVIEYRSEFIAVRDMLHKLDEALYRAKREHSRVAQAS